MLNYVIITLDSFHCFQICVWICKIYSLNICSITCSNSLQSMFCFGANRPSILLLLDNVTVFTLLTLTRNCNRFMFNLLQLYCVVLLSNLCFYIYIFPLNRGYSICLLIMCTILEVLSRILIVCWVEHF